MVQVPRERTSAAGAPDNQADTGDDVDDYDDASFGDLVPFGDPYWYQSWSSPYYDASHRKLRACMRKFIDEEITPNVAEWEAAREVPKHVFKRFAELGILASLVSNSWPAEHAKGLPVPGGVDPSAWNAFHFFVVLDEMCRCASGGLVWAIAGGLGIGLPPVMHFGSPELQQRIVPACLRGEKRICLAITEPSVGSDVANLTCSAVKSEDGKHYIVNGEKKWITNGVYADFFTVAVRTGGKGMGGISLLLIERTSPGVTTRKMDCMGVLSSGTTYIEFDEVKVPVENLIGRENKGFQLIMSNFNNERIGIAIQSLRFARICYEDAMKYASKRKTFGTLLRDHGVIRAKLGNMSIAIESTHSWIEQILYQTTKFDSDDLTLRAGGVVALVKARASEVFSYCAREAAQVLGGIAYTKGGQGERIERLYREVLSYTIPGGSAEIMIDLGMRQSIKIAEIMGAKL